MTTERQQAQLAWLVEHAAQLALPDTAIRAASEGRDVWRNVTDEVVALVDDAVGGMLRERFPEESTTTALRECWRPKRRGLPGGHAYRVFDFLRDAGLSKKLSHDLGTPTTLEVVDIVRADIHPRAHQEYWRTGVLVLLDVPLLFDSPRQYLIPTEPIDEERLPVE